MPEYRYSILVDDEVIAKNLTLPNALIFAEALFNKWFSETNLSITIQREDNDCCCIEKSEKDVIQV